MKNTNRWRLSVKDATGRHHWASIRGRHIVNRPPRSAKVLYGLIRSQSADSKDSYLLSCMNESLYFLCRGKFLSTTDFARGIGSWLSLRRWSRKLPLFYTAAFRVLPFGLSNVPTSFQRHVNLNSWPHCTIPMQLTPTFLSPSRYAGSPSQIEIRWPVSDLF